MNASRAAELVFLAAAAGVLLLSAADRYDHYAAWRATPRAHFAGERVVSSGDSYYWFRLAREGALGQSREGTIDWLRDFPDGRPYGPSPLLSEAIRILADLRAGDIYTSGMLLMIGLASLFVLPLALYGWRLGLPAAGLLGGLFGSFAPAYFARAGIHRVDTDGANLFFVWLLASSMTLVVGRGQPRAAWRSWLAAAVAGACLALFCRWYQQPGFWAIYVGCFALHLILLGVPRRRALELFGIFVLASNPWNGLDAFASLRDFVADYLLASDDGAGPLEYSHLTAQIAELLPLPVSRTLAGAIGAPLAAWGGLLGLLVALGRHWRRAAPILPMLVLGLLAITSSRRFAMYLAPLVGFGLGAIVDELVSLAGRARPALATPLWRTVIAVSTSAAVFAVLVGATSYGHRPRTPSSFSAAALAELARLGETLERPALLVHDWSAGYLLQEVTGAATLNDGLKPDPAIEHLLQRGLFHPDPRWLRGALSALAENGRAWVVEALDPDESDAWDATIATLGDAPATSHPVYLLLTNESLRGAVHYSRNGRWHPARGYGQLEGFDLYDCREAGDRLDCRKRGRSVTIDPVSGAVEGTPGLRRFLDITTQPPTLREWGAEREITAQVLAREGDRARVAFVSEAVYRSTLNRLYLGVGETPGWTLIHDAYPLLRVYRLAAK